MEEGAQTTIYDDFKFLTKEDLERLNLTNLIGTNLLRAYMHGFFIDYRLYKKVMPLILCMVLVSDLMLHLVRNIKPVVAFLWANTYVSELHVISMSMIKVYRFTLLADCLEKIKKRVKRPRTDQ